MENLDTKINTCLNIMESSTLKQFIIHNNFLLCTKKMSLLGATWNQSDPLLPYPTSEMQSNITNHPLANPISITNHMFIATSETSYLNQLQSSHSTHTYTLPTQLESDSEKRV